MGASPRPRRSATTTRFANTSRFTRGPRRTAATPRSAMAICFLAYTHVAHDCVIGNQTTFSNNAQIAGHVAIDDWAVLGAFAGVHQFCRVGAHAMLAAYAVVLQDVPPYRDGAGYPAKPHGTNSEGLRRRGFTPEDVRAVRRAYKTLYREGLSARGCEGRAREGRRRGARRPAARHVSRDRRPRHRPLTSSVRPDERRHHRQRSRHSTVGIVAGEASGDALGAALIEAVRARIPQVRFVGIAGPRMEAAGCEAWYPLEALSVRGIVEVLATRARSSSRSGAICADGFSRSAFAVRRCRRARLQPRPRAQAEPRRTCAPSIS